MEQMGHLLIIFLYSLIIYTVIKIGSKVIQAYVVVKNEIKDDKRRDTLITTILPILMTVTDKLLKINRLPPHPSHPDNEDIELEAEDHHIGEMVHLIQNHRHAS